MSGVRKRCRRFLASVGRRSCLLAVPALAHAVYPRPEASICLIYIPAAQSSSCNRISTANVTKPHAFMGPRIAGRPCGHLRSAANCCKLLQTSAFRRSRNSLSNDNMGSLVQRTGVCAWSLTAGFPLALRGLSLNECRWQWS